MKDKDNIKRLPVIDIKSFLYMNNDLSENIIKKLIGKTITFRMKDDLTGLSLFGILEEYDNQQLVIKRDGVSLIFELSDISGVEEFSFNTNKELSKECIGLVCEVTNYKDVSLIGLIVNIDEDELTIKIKTNDENLRTLYYPIEMIKNIRIIDR